MSHLVKKMRMLSRLCVLIKTERTGGLKNLAETLQMSRMGTYKYIQELKSMGAEIEYDHERKTYYFNNNFNLKFSIQLNYSNI